MRSARRWLDEGWDLVGADLPTFTLAAFIVISLSLLSAFILAVPLLVGMCIMFLEKAHGEKPTLHHLWEGFPRFPAAIVVWIIYLLAGIPFGSLNFWLYSRGHGYGYLGAAAEFVGHFLIATALFFTPALIADRDVSAREAVRLSWAQVRPRFGTILWCTVLFTLLILFGFVACFVGVLLTFPVAVGALVVAYRELYHDFETPQMHPVKAPDDPVERGE